MSANIELRNLELGELITSGKGAKSIQLTTIDGKPVIWQPSECLMPVFEPSVFNDVEATRVNLSLTPSDSIEKHLKALDSFLASQLATDSAKYFGQILTTQQVIERMQPSIRVSEKNHHSLRLKMNISGRAKVQVFDEERTARDLPTAWLDVSLRPRILVKGFWMIKRLVYCTSSNAAKSVSSLARAHSEEFLGNYKFRRV